MKREWWIILLAFLGGIALTNFLGSELLTTYGILNEYFLQQYSYQTVDGSRLFCHVAVVRVQAALFLYVLGRAIDGRVFELLVKGLAAATFGFICVVAIVNLGARGMLVVLCGLFPQWIFYLAAGRGGKRAVYHGSARVSGDCHGGGNSYYLCFCRDSRGELDQSDAARMAAENILKNIKKYNKIWYGGKCGSDMLYDFRKCRIFRQNSDCFSFYLLL